MSLLLPCGTAHAARNERLKVAALEIKPERGVDAGVARLLDEVILAQLSDDYDVLGKSDISSMLGFEQQKQMLGCSEEASCLAEVGGALGVDYIVSGNLGQVGSLYLINLKLLDATKAKVIKRVSETVEAKEEKLLMGVKSSVTRLMEAIEAARAGAAAPKPEPKPAAAAKPAPEAKPAEAPPAAPPPAEAKAPAPEVKPAETAAAGPAPAPTAPAAPARRSNALPWTGVALGVVTAGTGGFFGWKAMGTTSEIEANAKKVAADGSHIVRDTELRTQRSFQANMANVLVPAGLVVAVVSWLFVKPAASGGGGDGPILAATPLPDGAAVAVGGRLP